MSLSSGSARASIGNGLELEAALSADLVSAICVSPRG
jgi:hypothetical protein